MLYLLFAIICSSTIAFVFKFAENQAMNPSVVTSANYLIASVISLFMIINNRLLKGLVQEQSFYQELKIVLSTDGYLLSPYNSVMWGLLVGGIAGFFFFFSFLAYQKSVKENGIGLSGTFSKLGILLPMIFSIVLWGEIPSAVQWLGIFLSLLSIVLVNLSFEAMQRFTWNRTLLLLFVFGGLAEFSNKIYQQYALSTYKDIFLFTVFLSAFLISLIYAKKQQTKWTTKEILTGFAVGVPNLFSSYFLILSLDTLQTSIAFPIFSAGSIVFINMGGFLIFKENLSTKDKVAIGLVVIALVLLNL